MEEEIFDALKQSVKFVTAAVIAYINENDELDDFSDDEKEQLINVVFNSMTNTLKPEYALVMNEYLLELVDRSMEEETKDNIFNIIGWERDGN